MALISRRADPLLGYNFIVSLIDTSSVLAISASAASAAVSDAPAGGFSECSGLEVALDVEEYKEGGNNGAILKFPTRVKWTDITLKRGVAASTDLWDWHYGFVEGRGRRRDGIIILQTDLHVPNNIWYFRRGLPVKYTGPTLNATQNAVAVETIVIAHEGLYQVPAVGLAVSAVNAVADLF
jgi:phage tail-like protein